MLYPPNETKPPALQTAISPVLYHEDVLSLRNDWLLTQENLPKRALHDRRRAFDMHTCMHVVERLACTNHLACFTPPALQQNDGRFWQNLSTVERNLPSIALLPQMSVG
jgi:hypothetical protein